MNLPGVAVDEGLADAFDVGLDGGAIGVTAVVLGLGPSRRRLRGHHEHQEREGSKAAHGTDLQTNFDIGTRYLRVGRCRSGNGSL